MSQVRVNESSLTNIADAIRDKNHEVTKYKPSEMPAAISRIKTTDPVFDKLTVTENGKYKPTARNKIIFENKMKEWEEQH